jgi:hypothetical protein
MSLTIGTAGQFPDDEFLAFFRQTVMSVLPFSVSLRISAGG